LQGANGTGVQTLQNVVRRRGTDKFRTGVKRGQDVILASGYAARQGKGGKSGTPKSPDAGNVFHDVDPSRSRD